MCNTLQDKEPRTTNELYELYGGDSSNERSPEILRFRFIVTQIAYKKEQIILRHEVNIKSTPHKFRHWYGLPEMFENKILKPEYMKVIKEKMK